MKLFRILAILLFLSVHSSFAQLPNGSIAPDFEFSDLNGNTHHLYQYLDEGKVVFVKFFACHCPNCWAYHNTETLRNVYNNYGPEGTDQIRVIMIDYDEYNSDAFYGLGGYTQGDWTANNPIPMINAEGGDRWIFEAYDMNFYPLVYKICPDKTTEVMSTSFPWTTLYQKADDCPGTLDLPEAEGGHVYYDAQSGTLHLEHFTTACDLQVVSLSGRTLATFSDVPNGQLKLELEEAGVYFVQILQGAESSVLKIHQP